MAVFVLDKHKKPLMPCTEKRAILLLDRKQAVVHKMMPFTIRLKNRIGGVTQPVSIKLDPGSKTTGIALVRESEKDSNVIFLAELSHRGEEIKKSLEKRKNYRKRRRSANLRYRSPRFNNRPKPKGWLAPSLMHRVHSTMSWVKRLRKLCPVSKIVSELVRFDLQKLENPEISGIQYQQGELEGYEVREYLLEKFGRKCAYCEKKDIPLQVEHIQAKACGGSNRISNLTLACEKCNQNKGAKPIEKFLAKKPEVLKRILAQTKKPLKDATAVNATRWRLINALKDTDLPVETGSGGRTKWNRHRFNIPKTHALDAVCVGNVEAVSNWKIPTLCIKSMGRGSYQRTLVNASGFPRGYLMKTKSIFGFQTGDLVKAIVPKGKKIGNYTGRVAIRATGSFDIKQGDTLIHGISYKHCKLLQRSDGYQYTHVFLPTINDGVSNMEIR